MGRRRSTRDFDDQMRAFRRGVKPGIYEVFHGEFVNGEVRGNEKSYSGWKWRRFFRRFNRFLEEYGYVHVEVIVDGAVCQRFYVYRENTYNLTVEKLKNVQDYHREIGLAVGIPEFAVEEFVRRTKRGELYRVEIRRLGLVFTMERTEEDLRKLEAFLGTKGLAMRDARVK